MNDTKWKQWEYPHERIETLKSTPARNRLASGIYRNGYVFLRFRDYKIYELYSTGALTSTGTWKQENSSITLQDKTLQSNFYMDLDEKGRLRSVLLPGLYLSGEQYFIFKRIDKFPAGSGGVPFEPNERKKVEVQGTIIRMK